MRLIDADELYEKFSGLEAQALDHVSQLLTRDDDIVEWKIWSAILRERSAFKHDIFDAPTIDAIEVIRCEYCIHNDDYNWCDNHDCFTNKNAFCSDAERREA